MLAYPQIVPRLDFYKQSADDVLAAFDRHARITEVAPKASVTCSDADDQKFIDLAVAHQAMLLSKDGAVISMAKRLLAHGVRAQIAMQLIANGVAPACLAWRVSRLYSKSATLAFYSKPSGANP